MPRIHITGGGLSSHRSLNEGKADPALIAAVLAQLGFRGQFPLGPSPSWGGARVGADMTQLPTDGSPPKVEWLPLSAVAGNDIVAAATRDYELKPTKFARPGPLVIGDTLAVNLAMTSLLIGGRPVFAGSGAVPGILFSHLSVHNALSSFIASNNAPITFTLQNIHASVTQTVRGVWICDTAEIQVG
jgi:hypothetical protein